MARSLWSHRELIGQFARREVAVRHRGSHLGVLWAALHPLLLLAVYTFVFAVVWQARWSTPATDPAAPGAAPAGGTGEFALNVLCGIALFEVFSATISVAPSLIVNNPNYVKKVVFPLEILPLATLLSSAALASISLVVLLLGNAVIGSGVSRTLYLFPLVLLPLLMLTAGLAWLLASLGVFLRDLKQLVSGIVLQVLFLLTPIFYPVERLEASPHIPDVAKALLRLNPLAGIVEGGRRTLLHGREPDWAALAISAAAGAAAMILGYAFFMKSKRGFADVI